MTQFTEVDVRIFPVCFCMNNELKPVDTISWWSALVSCDILKAFFTLVSLRQIYFLGQCPSASEVTLKHVPEIVA